MDVKVAQEANPFQGLEADLEVVEVGHVREVILAQDHPDALDREVILVRDPSHQKKENTYT